MTHEEIRMMARARNLVYYRKIDSRPYAQYLHQLRELRADLQKHNHPILLDIFDIIPTKVIPEEVDITIEKIGQYLKSVNYE